MKKVFSTALALIMLVSMLFGTTAASAATMPSCTGQKVSNVTTNSARVDFTIKNPSCLTVKTCGMQIRKKGASSWTTKSETVTSSYQKKSSIPGWYTVGKGKEVNFALSSGTTYEYRTFCKYGNKTYYAGVSSFTTKKSITNPSLKNLKSSSVTTSSARIDFTINNPSCVTVKTCGMQIRKKGTSSWTTKSETVASSYQKKSSIPAWYTVGKGKEFNYTLSAGTTYEYRAFCVYSNKTFYSGVATFTTAKATTSSSNSKVKYSAVNPIKIPRIWEIPNDNTCHFFCVASVEAYALGMKYSYGGLNRTYKYGTDYNAYNSKYKKGGRGKGNEIDPVVKKMFALKGADNVDPINILGRLPVPFTRVTSGVGNNSKTYTAIYNQLKAGKPVVIYASGKSSPHATVVIGAKGGNTMNANNLIVMEIVRSWSNSQSNLNNAVKSPNTNVKNYKNCYMTLATWLNANNRKITSYSYPKTIKK